jgi:hypothetical protein
MTTAEAAYIQAIQSHGWHLSFKASEETRMTWWEALTPEDSTVRLVAMSIDDLWQAWLSHPLVIKKLFGIEEQRIVAPKEVEQPKGRAYDGLMVKGFDWLCPLHAPSGVEALTIGQLHEEVCAVCGCAIPPNTGHAIRKEDHGNGE